MAKIIRLFICACALILAISCQSHDRFPLNSFREALHFEPKTLNPFFIQDNVTQNAVSLIYDSLLKFDVKTQGYDGALAESWEILDDKKTYVFNLRQDVVWHDGYPFTAEDALQTFKLLSHPKTHPRFQGLVHQIESVEKISRYQIQIRYKKIYYRGLIDCGNVQILPAHLLAEYKDKLADLFQKNSVGTGPYKFKKWYDHNKIVLEKNENYWGREPLYEQYEFKFIKDHTLALQKLKKGEIDALDLREIEWLKLTNRKKFLNRFHKISFSSNNYSFLAWNNKNEIFKAKKVRQAMTHLLQREEILKKLKHNLGKVLTGPFHPYSKRYDASINLLTYNPQKALQLLEEEGWQDSDQDGWLDKDGKKFEFTLLLSDTPFSDRLSTIYKEDLKKIGIDMKLKKLDNSSLIDRVVLKKNFDAVLMKFGFGYDSDVSSVWHSDPEKGFYNFVSYKNKEVDALLEKTQTEFDLSKRNQNYKEIHGYLNKDQPYTFLYVDDALLAVSKKVKNPVIYERGIDPFSWEIDSDFKF